MGTNASNKHFSSSANNLNSSLSCYSNIMVADKKEKISFMENVLHNCHSTTIKKLSPSLCSKNGNRQVFNGRMRKLSGKCLTGTTAINVLFPHLTSSITFKHVLSRPSLCSFLTSEQVSSLLLPLCKGITSLPGRRNLKDLLPTQSFPKISHCILNIPTASTASDLSRFRVAVPGFDLTSLPSKSSYTYIGAKLI